MADIERGLLEHHFGGDGFRYPEETDIKQGLHLLTEGEYDRYFNLNNLISFLSTDTFAALVFRNIVTSLSPYIESKPKLYGFAAFVAGVCVFPGQFVITHQFIRKMLHKAVKIDSPTFASNSLVAGLKYLSTVGAALATGLSTFHLASRTSFFQTTPATQWIPTDSITEEIFLGIIFGAINGAFRSVFFNGKKKYEEDSEIQNAYLRALGRGVGLLCTALYGLTNGINYIASYVLTVENMEDGPSKTIFVDILVAGFFSIVAGELVKNAAVLFNTFNLYRPDTFDDYPTAKNLYSGLRFILGGLSASSKTIFTTLSFLLLITKDFPASVSDAVLWTVLGVVSGIPTAGYNFATGGLNGQVTRHRLTEEELLQKPISINDGDLVGLASETEEIVEEKSNTCRLM